MAIIKPFKATRPKQNKVHLVASRSVDNYNPTELRMKLTENPYTFLHVIKPDFQKNGSLKSTNPGILQRIKAKYQSFLKDNIFLKENNAAYYIYRQSSDEGTHTGILALASIDDYQNGVIKIHEQTLTQKEEKLAEYLEVCEFNAEPVCMLYETDKEIDAIVETILKGKAEYDFTTTDKKNHELWVVVDEVLVSKIEERFKKINFTYIADGHHRSASSTLLGLKKRKASGNFNGNEGFNYFLAIYFPEHELKIYDFNRLVRDLNGISNEAFFKALEQSFSIQLKGKTTFAPTQKHEFSLYFDGNWYQLNLKKHILDAAKTVTDKLDASILTREILHPILGIADLKTDERITFLNGLKGMKGLQQQVDSGKFAIAFGLFPVNMDELKAVADANEIMPPKTTWVEPKLRSGLTIFDLNDTII